MLNHELNPLAARRPRAAALLSTTTLLASAAPLAAAVIALTPAPMASAAPAPAPISAHRAGAVLNGGDPCQIATPFHSPGTFKLPLCAGD